MSSRGSDDESVPVLCVYVHRFSLNNRLLVNRGFFPCLVFIQQSFCSSGRIGEFFGGTNSDRSDG